MRNDWTENFSLGEIDSLILCLAQDERIYFFMRKVEKLITLCVHIASINSSNLKPWKHLFTVLPD